MGIVYMVKEIFTFGGKNCYKWVMETANLHEDTKKKFSEM